MDPILIKKSSKEGLISQKIAKKIVESVIFEVEKPLEMGPDLRKFRKKKTPVKSAVFEGERSLNMGRGFRPRTANPVKN